MLANKIGAVLGMKVKEEQEFQNIPKRADTPRKETFGT